jgi:excisionase family DNA binding protein
MPTAANMVYIITGGFLICFHIRLYNVILLKYFLLERKFFYDWENTAMTPQEVADYLKIAKNTVYELIKRGDLNGYKVGKKVRVDLKDVEEYKNRAKSKNAPGTPAKSSPGQAKMPHRMLPSAARGLSSAARTPPGHTVPAPGNAPGEHPGAAVVYRQLQRPVRPVPGDRAHGLHPSLGRRQPASITSPM